MTPQRWHEVKEICGVVLDCEPERRAELVAGLCSGNPDLKRDVEEMLWQTGVHVSILENPIWNKLTRKFSVSQSNDSGPSMRIGQQLGCYEIIAPLGKGGMGEVYRARDLKLKREVAIKILPDEFSSDADRVSRFQREAEVLASLNHPNIGAIYDFQEENRSRYLVLELIEGDTLADRIARGPIPAEEAIPIARDMCEALEAAHDKGIIHRDLKPLNIKITFDNRVKVLDFGLAKTYSANIDQIEPNSPTLTAEQTATGMILGTAAYMSPEQAKGQPVDKRADIWAFGAVLFEMLSRQRVFPGDDTSDVLAAILRGDPDWNALPATTPLEILELLRHCLEKDPKRRLRDIGDARWRLDRQREAPLAPEPRSRRAWIGWATAALIALVGFAGWLRPPAKSTQLSAALTIVPAPGTVVAAPGGQQAAPQVSPDGLSVLYSASGGDYVRHLNSLEPDRVRAMVAFGEPFWSPNSGSVAFQGADGLMKIRTPDGAAELIAAFPAAMRGGTWGEDGTILFAGSKRLYATTAGGGEPALLNVAGMKQGEYYYPEFLPEGKDLLFFFVPFDSSTEDGEVYLAHFSRGQILNPVLLMRNDTAARYTPAGGGRILFVRDNGLYSQKLNLQTRQLEGESELIQHGVASGPGMSVYRADFSVSRSGVVAFRPGTAALAQVTIFDRQGTEIGKAGPAGAIGSLSLSPDEAHLLAIGDRSWLLDVGQTGRLSLGRKWEWDLWFPDGSRLLGQRPGPGSRLGERELNGSGGVHELTDSTGMLHDISPDGKEALFMLGGGRGIFSMRLDSERSEPTQRVTVETGEASFTPGFSPDGRWIVYVLRTQGNKFAVFVQPFPGPGLRKQVAAIGRFPVWRKDGKEIVYLAGTEIWSVGVETSGHDLRFGSPHKLFSGVRLSPGANGGDRPIAVSRDGSRIYLPQAVEQPNSNVIHVKTGWFSTDDRQR
jgi:eukaryotic-like serine/threonine-protein kinase